MRLEDDNPTIGLILCSRKNEAIAKYSVLSEARQIFAAKYVQVLPTEQELTARSSASGGSSMRARPTSRNADT